jgi:hypothetical protein
MAKRAPHARDGMNNPPRRISSWRSARQAIMRTGSSQKMARAEFVDMRQAPLDGVGVS